jgi:hypothetical protein
MPDFPESLSDVVHSRLHAQRAAEARRAPVAERASPRPGGGSATAFEMGDLDMLLHRHGDIGYVRGRADGYEAGRLDGRDESDRRHLHLLGIVLDALNDRLGRLVQFYEAPEGRDRATREDLRAAIQRSLDELRASIAIVKSEYVR